MLIVKHFVAPQKFVKKTKFWAGVVQIELISTNIRYHFYRHTIHDAVIKNDQQAKQKQLFN